MYRRVWAVAQLRVRIAHLVSSSSIQRTGIFLHHDFVAGRFAGSFDADALDSSGILPLPLL